MKTYAYCSFLEKVNSRIIHEEILRYCSRKSIKISKFLSSSLDLQKPLCDRELFQLLSRDMMSKDVLVVYEAGNLGRSICQVIEILKMALNRGINIHFVKANLIFYAKESQEKSEAIRLLSYVSNAFSRRLSSDNLFRRDLTRRSLGRPKGRNNHRLKLDDHQTEIVKYLNLKISKRSIAKLVQCHPQTLQDWLVRRKIFGKEKVAADSN
jgi:DNA invertase Pin-like site-specific DNA recombinase